jgi:hypothetical protein
MLAQDSYNAASTNVKASCLVAFIWSGALTHSKKLSCIPDDTTGLERIMLAAQGDLQRLLR